MKRLALLLPLLTLGAAPPVPATISFAAHIVDDTTGKALTGPHHLAFELFDASTGGHSLWQEGEDVMVDDGVVNLDLGSTKALDTTVFSGPTVFLQITLDDTPMDDRIQIGSVPYAIRAGLANDANTVGGKTLDGVQTRVTGTCSSGSFLTAVAADGTVSCGAGATGTGDITAVAAGNGLMGGGTAGDVSLGIIPCASGEILKSTGTSWTCAPDAKGLDGVTAGSGLMGGGTTGTVTLSLINTCAAGQLLKWSGAGWMCANDIDTDTNSGGTITGVSVSPSSGLVGGGTTGTVSLSLPMTCASGQMLKWNGAAWACANDVDTDTNSGGTITAVLAGNGLIGGGATGNVTVNVVGGPGIIVNADNIALDTTTTDALYVKKAGDAMAGNLDMTGHFLTNRGCPSGYVKVGTAFCLEAADVGGLTFTGAAKRCVLAGSHLCSSAEQRAAMSIGGLSLTTTVLFDWLDDQDAVGTALYLASTTNAESPEGSQATSTTSQGYSRCCRNVE